MKYQVPIASVSLAENGKSLGEVMDLAGFELEFERAEFVLTLLATFRIFR